MKFSAFIASLAIVGSEAFAPGIGGHARSSTGELSLNLCIDEIINVKPLDLFLG
jgi:hypothetical protein